MDSVKFNFAFYTNKIDQFHQARQNSQQSQYRTVESLAQADERVHDFPPSTSHCLNWKGQLLQQWKQQEQREGPSDPLRRRDQKFQRKEQQRANNLPFARNVGYIIEQDIEEPRQIDTSVQAHRLHEAQAVHSQQFPFQATEQDSPAIRLFQGIPLSVEGAAAIRKFSSTFQAMLLKFSAKQKDTAFLRVLAECANAGYLPAVATMVYTQKQLGNLIADWPTHRSTLRLAQESKILKSITGMQHSKGMPTRQNIDDLKAWCTNEQGEVDFALLPSITGMQNGKGMPTQQNINDLKAWCTNKQGQVDFFLLSSITGMQHSKGMPTQQNINDLKAWCTDEQGKVDFSLLRSITSMQCGKGIPTRQNINDLKAWCTDEQGQVDFVFLRSITGMQNGKGMPTQQNINDLKTWCTDEQGRVDFALLRFITRMQNGKGMPSKENFEVLKLQYRLNHQQTADS